MENDDKEILRESFPSNSKTNKPDPQDIGPKKKKVEKVISGKVRTQKRSFGKKIAETFMEDNTRSVGSYVFHDVLIPAAKALICDVVGWGGFAEMLLFGNQRMGRGTSIRPNGWNRTNYGAAYSSASYVRDPREQRDRGRDMSRMSRARHDFREIVLESRGEAEDVLSHLIDMIQSYGVATVADLYDLVGITGEFTDNKWGWNNLANSNVSRVREGYLINLPSPQPLD